LEGAAATAEHENKQQLERKTQRSQQHIKQFDITTLSQQCNSNKNTTQFAPNNSQPPSHLVLSLQRSLPGGGRGDTGRTFGLAEPPCKTKRRALKNKLLCCGFVLTAAGERAAPRTAACAINTQSATKKAKWFCFCLHDVFWRLCRENICSNNTRRSE
jgi:hypothetical protein